jgi:hypothetical protein
VMGDDYRYLGNGPAATGSESGWRMDSELYARCVRCGSFVSLSPTESAQCTCGALNKDADSGRFGSSFGDDTIAAYQRST